MDKFDYYERQAEVLLNKVEQAEIRRGEAESLALAASAKLKITATETKLAVDQVRT